MKKINLVVFNEPYWDKGLIYSQNILPLVRLSRARSCKITVLSFTSIFKFFENRNERKKAKKELGQLGVDVVDFPVLFYPTRYMHLQWYLIPYYFFNVFLYLFYLSARDCISKEKPIYNIRSYEAALGFLKIYPYKNNLVFDPRTDWIKEKINIGLFKKNGLTVRYWNRREKEILLFFKKTIFISDLFKEELLKKHFIDDNSEKYRIVYNPINYSLFENCKKKKENNFLYTGSLGHWNNLDVYMDFFASILPYTPDSKLIVCTNTPSRKIMPIYNSPKYDSVRSNVELYFNVPMDRLPDYYARCRYGLQLMRKRDSRVGVKFIEYVAAGVTPIVNSNVEGACFLARKYKLGIVVDNDDVDYAKIYESLHEDLIDEKSELYKQFRNLTDLNSIEKVIEPIFF
ncbi:Glycosyltransferase involved in cell wall bisynthesis [Fibrobacter sp. UWR3]|uniref:glycosyltransferase n=1 Tax=Fibrobacter sp. UWR3 TaxID=1896217 RepID=UPI0009155F55|nr:glycosyltransferase [Fibrobacter sp. UWR3]SHN08031.1 Glycosyltransferase involved in cell wall bisynthesis [Fibrobacter sp. UWR3]